VTARAYYREVAPHWLKTLVRPHKSRLIKTLVWLRTTQVRERLRPAFLIIGVGKAGTTSLFSYLVSHPQIAEPLTKEINYFNQNWGRPLDWYLAHFARVSRVSPGTITGEASPGYIFNSANPARVAATLPEVKLIVLLRDPVLRAISHYHHDVSHKIRSPRGLLETMVAEGWARWPELTDRLVSEIGWRQTPITPRPEERWPPLYIRDGLYAERLAPWLERFDRSRMLILKSEDLFANPRDVYERTLQFLDVPSFDLGPMKAHNVGTYSDLDPRVFWYLSEIYAEPNRRLQQLVGEDFNWEMHIPGRAGQLRTKG
jgi:hypothetical protein